jgi:hypothetical protein
METLDIIDTTKVKERRQLHFTSLDDILADLDHLAEAPEVRTLGNWSAGQIFQHLAVAFTCSIDGFPFHLPAPVRFLFRLFLKRAVLNKPMSAGFRLPAKAATKLVPLPIGKEEGLENLRRAIHRLQTEEQRSPNPVVGKLTREEWDNLHCRHAELHLSFLVPVS